jgi:hypothetical protein
VLSVPGDVGGDGVGIDHQMEPGHEVTVSVSRQIARAIQRLSDTPCHCPKKLRKVERSWPGLQHTARLACECERDPAGSERLIRWAAILTTETLNERSAHPEDSVSRLTESISPTARNGSLPPHLTTPLS